MKATSSHFSLASNPSLNHSMKPNHRPTKPALGMVMLILAIAHLQAEDPKPSFRMVATTTHGEVMVERHRAAEGTEQIWLASTADPTKRHLLYTHHRRADVVFSDDDSWLVINDHAGSGYSGVLLYRQKAGLEYEQVADLTGSAWKYFNQRNGFKATPFDHAHAEAACWVGTDPPTLLIRLSGHLSGPTGIIKASRGWHCLYNIRTQSFSTDLDALNHKNTKL